VTDSLIYRATEVVSTFSRGQFVQELHGILVLFDIPDDNTKELVQTAAVKTNTGSATRGSVQTSRLPPQSALGESPGVSFADQVGAEFGAYFGDGTTGTGTVPAPAQPTRSQAALPSSTLALEGFGDQDPPALPAQAPTAPTSGGQVIGPAASGSAAVASQGGASGRGVGQPPSVVATLSNGSTIIVINQQQINDLVSGGLLLPQQAARATQQLERAQQAANSPVTNRAPQQTAREP
jgi:hypothetical protein